MSHKINNEFYNDLGERWYTAQDDPVALLRAESRLHGGWILERLGEFGAERLVPRKCRVLDIACGAGFLSNELARRGHDVTGVDLSLDSLAVARRHDATGTARYEQADATRLPFPDATATTGFDAITMMDFLEHVEDPRKVIAEAARVLKPGGQFFFHTFNRTWLAWLIVIRGVEWFVRNTPPDMHVLSLFLRPEEVRKMCFDSALHVGELVGSRPVIASRAFWQLLATRRVPEDFRFRFTKSLALSYLGVAVKKYTSD